MNEFDRLNNPFDDTCDQEGDIYKDEINQFNAEVKRGEMIKHRIKEQKGYYDSLTNKIIDCNEEGYVEQLSIYVSRRSHLSDEIEFLESLSNPK